MITENYNITCCVCGKFCIPADSLTIFGCSSYDPPEPHDPEFYCKKCAVALNKKWKKHFKNGGRSGDYQKSLAEMDAAEKAGLVWIGSMGVGILGTRYSLDSNQYVNKELYDRFKELPYYGWCMKCGRENRGGYCSHDKCENSFKSKTN